VLPVRYNGICGFLFSKISHTATLYKHSPLLL
jgi:hypothetical protein